MMIMMLLEPVPVFWSIYSCSFQGKNNYRFPPISEIALFSKGWNVPVQSISGTSTNLPFL